MKKHIPVNKPGAQQPAHAAPSFVRRMCALMPQVFSLRTRQPAPTTTLTDWAGL